MDCQEALSQTETLDLLDTFGEPSRRKWKHIWSLAQPITHKQMKKKKLQT